MKTDSLFTDYHTLHASDTLHSYIPREEMSLTCREIPTKEEGLPVATGPRMDTVVTVILLSCFFLSAYILARSKRFLLQQLKDFISHRARTSIFVTSTVADVRYLTLLILQTCVLSGLCFFTYFANEQPGFPEQPSSSVLIGIYVAACLTYLCFKWLLYFFLGRVFFSKPLTGLWMESYATLIYFVGFAIFPCVLLQVYLDLSAHYIAIMGFVLLTVVKILMFYKWLKLFYTNIYGLILLILYFCALEIVPFFLFHEGLIQLNNVLLINI